jgi:FkbM family methyltransferase
MSKNTMMKIIINFICLFIPSKNLRRKLRKSLLNKYERKNRNGYYIRNKVRQMSMKMSMPDDIFQFDNIKMYVPDYPLDHIQEIIVENKDFYEKKLLNYLDQYISEDTCVLEIGANIGNHSVYWGKVRNVKHLYCFEPILKTFQRLEKNISINNLQNKTSLFNKAVGKENSKGVIDSFNMENIGATSIKTSIDGDIEIVKLDDIKFEHKIDFVKIDVEGFELDVLNGMIGLLNQDKPSTVIIESFKENASETIRIMESIGYTSLGDSAYKDNYIFTI